MWTHGLTEFDELVFLLLRDPHPLPPEDVAGIVQHYMGSDPPAYASHADLLLLAVARPEFDEDQLDDVRQARDGRPFQIRGALLAGRASRPDADVNALLAREKSLKARLYAAQLTLSAPLLGALVDQAPPKLLLVALDNPHRPDEVDLAAIELEEQPHGYLGRNIPAMLRRSPRVEARVRASDSYSLRGLAWDWCDTSQERLDFAVREIERAIEAGNTSRFLDDVLVADDAVQLPRSVLRDFEAMLDAAVVALAEDTSYWGTYRHRDHQQTLEQVQRLLDMQTDEPHVPVAVLLDRVARAERGEPTEQAEQRVLEEARALLGHGAGFWSALAGAFDVDATIPDLVDLSQLLAARPKRVARKAPAKRVAQHPRSELRQPVRSPRD